ncbi:hypothetical protein E2C01_008591 [Portunus trituberculatus]|uniref:Uncharacterized protein n=1 Tax=Portunus trituberculatus TaxID=210409 RepID=A0A5B7D179_PORTR|nr:hypothetical protein [Portunus trituberculatus]
MGTFTLRVPAAVSSPNPRTSVTFTSMLSQAFIPGLLRWVIKVLLHVTGRQVGVIAQMPPIGKVLQGNKVTREESPPTTLNFLEMTSSLTRLTLLNSSSTTTIATPAIPIAGNTTCTNATHVSSLGPKKCQAGLGVGRGVRRG